MLAAAIVIMASAMMLMTHTVQGKWQKSALLQAFDDSTNGTDYVLSFAVPIITGKGHFIEYHLHPLGIDVGKFPFQVIHGACDGWFGNGLCK